VCWHWPNSNGKAAVFGSYNRYILAFYGDVAPLTPLPDGSVTLPVTVRWQKLPGDSSNTGSPIAWSNFFKYISNQY
jgi:hypothetical protein